MQHEQILFSIHGCCKNVLQINEKVERNLENTNTNELKHLKYIL